MNRLLVRQPDPSLTSDVAETFTYTSTGKRATMTDASGTTTYIYDDHDRLSQKQTPQGTLTYTYDPAGNVASMKSSNTNGIYVEYTYDSLNRLATVVDHGLVGQQTTTYSYDPASNLATVEYPNGLQSTFTPDTLNRLTSLNNGKLVYDYSLDAVGNRQKVVEHLPNQGGRTVKWSYDNIYRLTNENISADPNSKTGEVTYGLDPVGNRLSLGLSQGSNLPGISAILPGSVSYDQDDRLSTETYDHNGNTLTSGGKTFTYDFANRLKSMAAGSVAVTIQYDADGNRVAKTVNGANTRYLVDDLNPTGYAQVVEEVVGGAATRQYTFGLQRISQNQPISNVWTPSFYGYDGGGTVRLLTDSIGTVTDTYDYDAWGNEVNTTGSTPNGNSYRGEQYDADLGLYYLRARYYNALVGRFLTTDPEDADPQDPATLHRYIYGASDPVNRLDPSGRLTSVEWRLLTYRIAGAAGGTALMLVAMQHTNFNSAASITNIQPATAVTGAASAINCVWLNTANVADVALLMGGVAVSSTWTAVCPITCFRGHGKGERGRTAKPDGTPNPGKHARWDPVRQRWTVKDPNGKWIEKPKGWMDPPSDCK